MEQKNKIMKFHKFDIAERHSEVILDGSLVVTVLSVFNKSCKMVIGSPGLPNVNKEIGLGEAVLFESLGNGLLEVRLLKTFAGSAGLLVSEISPSPGIMGGFVEQNQDNQPFSVMELERITKCIDTIKENIAQNNALRNEQIEYLIRKTEEIGEASKRLGKKDWMNYVVGVLSSTTASLALSPEIVENIFKYYNDSFRWLFESFVKLLN